MSALDRLKLIQQNFKQTWNGIACESCARPGTSNFVNRKRAITVIESAELENERQKQLWKIFTKLRDLDEERTSSANGTSRSTMVNTGSSFYNQHNKNQSEFLVFKNVALDKNSALSSASSSNIGYSGKNFHIENSELLFKLQRFENKMVRNLLDSH
jgi:hypothetical protein